MENIIWRWKENGAGRNCFASGRACCHTGKHQRCEKQKREQEITGTISKARIYKTVSYILAGLIGFARDHSSDFRYCKKEENKQKAVGV